jgi:hypothetical protein
VDCRIYSRRLKALQQASRAGDDAPVSPQLESELYARLRARLLAAAEKKETPGRPQALRWGIRIGIAAGGLSAAVVLIFLLLSPENPSPDWEIPAFSIEDSLARLTVDFRTDPELENSFNAVLADSIRNLVPLEDVSPRLGALDSSLLRESLTPDELNFLLEALKKESKS